MALAKSASSWIAPPSLNMPAVAMTDHGNLFGARKVL